MTDVAGSVQDTGNPTPIPDADAASAAPAPDATQTPTPDATPQVAAPETPWIDKVSDPDLRGWAEKKGLQNGTFENVLGSYHNLEKMMGADKAERTVTLLGADATPEEVNEFYNRLGRPEEPAGYEIPVPEGGSPEFAEWAQNTFHGAGLSKDQAAKVAEAWEAYVGVQQQTLADSAEAAVNDATNELKREWGAAYERNVNAVDMAAAKLGMSDEQLQALNQSMGGAAAMKFVHNLAVQMGDDVFEEGEVTNPNAMTPEAAKQELDTLMGSKEFQEAWLDRMHPSHKAMVERKSQLARMISGSAA